MNICDDELQIIYKHNKPYRIRDVSGFLFFFPDHHAYPGQDERYRLEVEQQHRLAGYLLGSLQLSRKRIIVKEPV